METGEPTDREEMGGTELVGAWGSGVEVEGSGVIIEAPVGIGEIRNRLNAATPAPPPRIETIPVGVPMKGVLKEVEPTKGETMTVSSGDGVEKRRIERMIQGSEITEWSAGPDEKVMSPVEFDQAMNEAVAAVTPDRISRLGVVQGQAKEKVTCIPAVLVVAIDREKKKTSYTHPGAGRGDGAPDAEERGERAVQTGTRGS